MCKHVFEYPEDTRNNYNIDGKTLTGVCRYCGVTQKAYGMRWIIPIEESFLQQIPYGEISFVDKNNIIC